MKIKKLTSPSSKLANGLMQIANGIAVCLSISGLEGTLYIVDLMNLGLQLPVRKKGGKYF